MLFVFDKKGMPHASFTATLKTSPETAVDGLEIQRPTLKIRKEETKWFLKYNSSMS